MMSYESVDLKAPSVEREVYTHLRKAFYECLLRKILQSFRIQGVFLDVLKKTQARKNSKLKQNLLKLKQKFRKNSKTANSS